MYTAYTIFCHPIYNVFNIYLFNNAYTVFTVTLYIVYVRDGSASMAQTLCLRCQV